MSNRTEFRRLPERGTHDRAVVDTILDEALICHLGFAVDNQPFVVPTIHARDGDALYVHGSPASRLLRTLASGVEACVTVTLVDGLVLARSVFHHSINYRSVMVFGTAEKVTEPAEKERALEVIVEHIARGRTAEARPPSEAELKATLVLRLRLDEVSAKVRTGGPKDDEADADYPVWAGVLPLTLVPGEPLGDANGRPVSPSVLGWRRP
jgi:nitroimidazol reductase NimA-like FMN-containing flavoprotein (pyridoxamine 5'-phosphate oxidase superfamily)